MEITKEVKGTPLAIVYRDNPKEETGEIVIYIPGTNFGDTKKVTGVDLRVRSSAAAQASVPLIQAFIENNKALANTEGSVVVCGRTYFARFHENAVYHEVSDIGDENPAAPEAPSDEDTLSGTTLKQLAKKKKTTVEIVAAAAGIDEADASPDRELTNAELGAVQIALG